MGGFIIFATKLDQNNINEYESQISTLETQQHWKFVTDHVFFRYDKQFGGQGNFSNK